MTKKTKIGASKLNYNTAERIKTLCETTDLTDGEIGRVFDISRPHINHIRHSRRWFDVESISTHIKEEKVSKNPLKMIHDLMVNYGLDKLEYGDMEVFMYKENE